MINVHRITTGNDLSFEKASILEPHERAAYPNFFEDANFIFKTQDGLRCLPYYNITVIEVDKIRRSITGGIPAIRLSLGWNLTYGPITIIPPELYNKYRVPILLPLADQFTFVTNEGMYITTDYNINILQLK